MVFTKREYLDDGVIAHWSNGYWELTVSAQPEIGSIFLTPHAVNRLTELQQELFEGSDDDA